MSSRIRKDCSSFVAAVNREVSNSRLRSVEPVPLSPVSCEKTSSTAPTVRCAASLGGVSNPATVRQPAPIRPCTSSPDSQATTVPISCGLAAAKSSASAAIFALRDRVARTAAEAATTSLNSTRRP